jgi:hypothetical protein
VINPTPNGKNEIDNGSHLFCAIGLSFPVFDDTSEEQCVKYTINTIEYRQLFGAFLEQDEDEVGNED